MPPGPGRGLVRRSGRAVTTPPSLRMPGSAHFRSEAVGGVRALGRVAVAIAGAKFGRERGVRDRSGRIWCIRRDRLAVARRFGKANIPRDDRLEDAVAEMSPNLASDVGGQLRSTVVHRQYDALDRELRVEVVADEIESREQLRQSFQGVVLTLERDENGFGGGQCVDGEESQRWRTVHEDVVVFDR